MFKKIRGRPLLWSQGAPLYCFSLLFLISPPSLFPFLFFSFGTLQVWLWQLEPPPLLRRAKASGVALVIDAHSQGGGIYAFPSHHRLGCHRHLGCHHPNRLIIAI
jgi:hypothetical protein